MKTNLQFIYTLWRLNVRLSSSDEAVFQNCLFQLDFKRSVPMLRFVIYTIVILAYEMNADGWLIFSHSPLNSSNILITGTIT